MVTTRGLWLALAVALVTTGASRGEDLVTDDDLTREIETYLSDLDELLNDESESYDIDAFSPEGAALEAVCSAVVQAPPNPSDEEFAGVISKMLAFWNRCLLTWNSKSSLAQWEYSTDLTDENEKKLEEVQTKQSALTLSLARAAQAYMNDDRYNTLDDDARRQIRLFAFSTTPSNPEDVKKLIEVGSRLEETYSKATVLGKSLEPDLTALMAGERDAELLLAAWWGWRKATGPNMRDDYETLVSLLNKGATENNFTSYAEAWLESQFDETSDVEAMSEKLWKQLEPLYQELHAYVRDKLRRHYTEQPKHGKGRPKGADGNENDVFYDQMVDIFSSGGIPAHLTGNMWAQSWQNVYDIVKPFDIPEVDYDSALQEQNYTVERLFSTAQDFYTSIGLYPMTSQFDECSMKVKPSDGRQVVCHASASDMYSDGDFRIKMCTEVNMEYFETIHHEMGHIEYFMAYSPLPTIYRDGANSAFHEAIGDTISLSALSHTHLRAIGLDDGGHGSRGTPHGVDKKMTDGPSLSEKRTLNNLMEKALFKVAFLPFGYLIDQWRWDVFRGKATKADYNKHWWDLRLKYQGIVAPVPRSKDDFDPGAKYHIPANSPYICYFISFILQFQFYEAMCEASGHQGALHDCDFYHSQDAGEKLLEMLQLGKSVPWPSAIKVLTGASKTSTDSETGGISTDSIIRYFQPLYDWLKQENKNNGVKVGWKKAKINWKD